MKISQTVLLLSFAVSSLASVTVTFPFDLNKLSCECTDSYGDKGTFLIQDECKHSSGAEVVGFLKSIGAVVCCVLSRNVPTEIKLEIKVGTRSKNYCQLYGAKKQTQLDFHIVGGTESDVGEFPHAAVLGYDNLGEIEYNCGGALISESFVITAAHCCNRRKPIIVRLGRVSR